MLGSNHEGRRDANRCKLNDEGLALAFGQGALGVQRQPVH
jgi:hypothetical protein